MPTFRRRGAAVLTVLAVGLAALSGVGDVSAAAAEYMPASTYVVPGGQVFPESVCADPVSGFFYVSGARDGTIYRGRPGVRRLEVYLPGGTDGRTMAQGLRLDDRGRLYVAGGVTGQMWVYDTRDRSLVRRFDTGLREGTFVNDLEFDADGNAYFTDSHTPVLWRVPASELVRTERPGTPERFLDFNDTVVRYQEGFNVNGVVPARGGRSLIVIQSNTGKLYRIRLATRDVSEIPLKGGPLSSGDSITPVSGDRLLITRNVQNQIVTVRLGASGASVTKVYRDATFRYPTAAVIHRGRLLVPNSQFDKWEQDDPELPFTVSAVPLKNVLGVR
ncbi:hypothetical protein ABGB14_41455 [Nonomuraea sp. B10E15]|uniref:SMP-30/gluconolactonase/LRE family protein n=1 Tax=Nonomuraea sp. B10E15 TaxID=3153560 RepID=UPI00325D26EC